MGIGHVAVGLGLKSVEPRLNAGWLVFAAFLSDFLLGWFALGGWETYEIPPDYSSKHYLLLTFPWSHGLLPLLLWSAILGAFFLRLGHRAAGVVGIAALSHFLLDALVHVRGLPIAGPGSPALGLGLWRHLPVESSLEAAMALAAIALYWRAQQRFGMAIYVCLLGAFTIAGQVTAVQAPPRSTLVASWIAAPVVIAAIAGFFDRRRVRHG